MCEFIVIQIPLLSLDEEEDDKRPEGAIDKYWQYLPNLGRTLVKVDLRGAWVEKITEILAELIGLPVARCELVERVDGLKMIASPSFLYPNAVEVPGEELLEKALGKNYFYTLDAILKVLDDGEIDLPIGFTPSETIARASDLMVGFLIYDSWIGNIDRHARNWGVQITLDGKCQLLPTYDHGIGLGVRMPEDKIPKDINGYSGDMASSIQGEIGGALSMDKLTSRLLKLRPAAAKFWIDQISIMPITDLPTIKLITIAPENTERIVVSSQSAIWEEFLDLQISPATRRSYAATLKDFFRREFDRKVSPEAIEQFLSSSEHDGLTHILAYRSKLIAAGMASATINARLAGLRAFVTHAFKRKLCAFRLDDIRSVKTQPYKNTRGISIEQFQKLIDRIDRSTVMGKRNYAMLRLLWDNALRRAEICGLDRSDFFWKEARLYLKGKGKIDKEPIDLAPATVEAICDWLAYMGESSNPALFISAQDTRISPGRLYEIVGELATAAGIDRLISPHRIRHSSITALLDLNAGDVRSAQAHSRHKNLATLILYDDSRQQLQGKAAKTLADAIVPN